MVRIGTFTQLFHSEQGLYAIGGGIGPVLGMYYSVS